MTNYFKEAMEMSLYDTQLPSEHFKFYFDRDLSLDQIDAENSVSDLDDRIVGIKKYIKVLTNAMSEQRHDYGSIAPQTSESYYSAVNYLMKLENNLIDAINNADQCASRREAGTSQFMEAEIDKKQSTGQEIIEFLHLYINKISLTELSDIYHITCDMHANKEISWYEYLVIAIATTQKLAMNTRQNAGWWEECTRLKANKDKFQPRREIPGLDTRFYGEMNIDMESAIDYMRYVRNVAEENSCTPFEIAAADESKQYGWENNLVHSTYDISEDVDINI